MGFNRVAGRQGNHGKGSEAVRLVLDGYAWSHRLRFPHLTKNDIRACLGMRRTSADVCGKWLCEECQVRE